MRKWVFAVLLLQVHNCFQPNPNLNAEIIEDLQLLNNLKVTFPKNIRVPGDFMLKHMSLCVGVFSEELRNLLRNVTTKPKSERNLKRLESNLELLETHPKNETNCTMNNMKSKRTHLNRHIKFMQKLNSGQ